MTRLSPRKWLPELMRWPRGTEAERLAWFRELGRGWMLQCDPREYADALRFMLATATRTELDQTMTAKEREVFASLPDEMTVYRGVTEYNAFGVAWTTSRIVAVNIAGGLARPGDPPPQHHMLLTGRVHKTSAFIKLWPPKFIVMEVVAPDVVLLSREDVRPASDTSQAGQR